MDNFIELFSFIGTNGVPTVHARAVISGEVRDALFVTSEGDCSLPFIERHHLEMMCSRHAEKVMVSAVETGSFKEHFLDDLLGDKGHFYGVQFDIVRKKAITVLSEASPVTGSLYRNYCRVKEANPEFKFSEEAFHITVSRTPPRDSI